MTRREKKARQLIDADFNKIFESAWEVIINNAEFSSNVDLSEVRKSIRLELEIWKLHNKIKVLDGGS